MTEPYYITQKLQNAFDKAGVRFMQTVIAAGIPGFVQGIRPDGKIMVSHSKKDCPPEWNVKFWKLVDYDPKDVKPTSEVRTHGIHKRTA